MINLDYVLSLKLSGKNSGKEKATAEKIKYLQKLTALRSYTLDTISKGEKNKVIKMFLLELFYLYDVILKRKEKPGIIIARSVFYFGSFLIAKIYKIPLIIEVHADILD